MIIHMFKPITYAMPRVNLDVTMEFEWLRMCHCRFISCSKCISLIKNVDNKRGCACIGTGHTQEISVAYLLLGFPCNSKGKESACNAGFDPWIRKIPGEGNSNPPQYSCLENPIDREAWQAIVHGVAKS